MELDEGRGYWVGGYVKKQSVREGRFSVEQKQTGKRGRARKGREQRELPHLELPVHTVPGRSCGKVNSTGEFKSVFYHLQPSKETIEMGVLL